MMEKPVGPALPRRLASDVEREKLSRKTSATQTIIAQVCGARAVYPG